MKFANSSGSPNQKFSSPTQNSPNCSPNDPYPLDFHEFKDDWSSNANSGRRVACCLIEHGDIVQMPDDSDAITEMTSSTEKLDTSTTAGHSSTESSSETESTTAENSTDASQTKFLSAVLISFFVIF